MRPAAAPPTVMSKKTTGFGMSLCFVLCVRCSWVAATRVNSVAATKVGLSFSVAIEHPRYFFRRDGAKSVYMAFSTRAASPLSFSSHYSRTQAPSATHQKRRLAKTQDSRTEKSFIITIVREAPFPPPPPPPRLLGRVGASTESVNSG